MLVYNEATGRWEEDGTGGESLPPPPPPDFQAIYDRGGFAPGEKDALAKTYAGNSRIAQGPFREQAGDVPPKPVEIPFVRPPELSAEEEANMPKIIGYGKRVILKRPGQGTINAYGESVSPEYIKDVEDTVTAVGKGEMSETQLKEKIRQQEGPPGKPSDQQMSVFDKWQDFKKIVMENIKIDPDAEYEKAKSGRKRSYYSNMSASDMVLLTPMQRQKIENDADQYGLQAKDHAQQKLNGELTTAKEFFNKQLAIDAGNVKEAPLGFSADNRAVTKNDRSGKLVYGDTREPYKGGPLRPLTEKDALTGKSPTGYRQTSDGSLEPIPGGPADIKQQTAFSKDTSALEGISADVARLGKAAKQLKDHPGLSRITGIMGKIPNIPGSDAANADALLGTLKSQTAFSVLQTMRNNSKTGGALGQVSDKEGKLLEDNLAALDKAQSYEAYKAALQKIIDYTDGSIGRTQKAYDMRWGDKKDSGGTSPTKPRLTPAQAIEELNRRRGKR